MRGKKVLVLLMCISFLFSLFGCGKKHVLDGPGMVNTLVWESFELSRSDSYYPHNFWFSLTVDNGFYLLTGECADKEGNTYEAKEGIRLSNEEAEALRRFNLEKLPDKSEPTDEELILPLDAPAIRLTLIFADGSKTEKSVDGDTAIEIYEELLPYFINN